MGRLVEPVPSMHTKINTYFDLKKEIHDYFGYKEDWVTIPMDDQRDQYWMLTSEGIGGQYVHSPIPFTEETMNVGNEIYGGWLYCQRFLKKWVYRGERYTLVCADTKTDGNKFLMIFDNHKECKDDYLKKLYIEKWSKF